MDIDNTPIQNPAENVNDALDQVMGSGSQVVNWVQNRFENCFTALEPRRTRLFSNLSKYCGYQLTEKQIAKLDKARRIPIVMNLSKRKVQGLAAAIVKNIWDVTYSPSDGKRNSLMFALDDMQEIDKSYSHWDYNFLMHVIYALIGDSCMEITLNNDIDPLGRIGWDVCQPGTFLYDPNWKTGIQADLDFCFKYMQLTTDQLLRTYPDQSGKIKVALLGDLGQGGNFDVPSISQYKDYRRNKTLNGLYNVIEYNYIVEEEVVHEVALNSGIELPDTDDDEIKKRFIEANQIPYEDIKSIYCTEKRAKIITICPDLVPESPLYNGYDIFQIKRLRFFPLSAERIVGEPFGIMDVIASMQDAINKAINNVQGIIDSSAHGGGVVNPEMFGNDPVKMAEAKKRWADPLYKEFGDPDAFKGDKKMFIPWPHTEVDAAIFTQLNKLLYELNNDMLPINPASEGQSEHAGEPGIVFNMKMQVIEQAQLVLMKNIEQFLLEIGEGYVDGAKLFYRKDKRTFYKKTGEEIVINDAKMLPGGDVAIDNDIGSLQKVRTIVQLSPKSPNSRFTQRMTQLDILNLLLKTPQENVELIAATTAKILETIDFDDEEEKLMATMLQRRLQLAKLTMDKLLNPQPPVPKDQSPHVSIPFKELPPEGKTSAMKKAGLDITPQGTPQPGQPGHPVNQMAQNLSPLMAQQQPQGAVS
jgi:hypothetical protein